MTVSNYSQIYNLGHVAVRQIFTGPVAVQEKVDGSQFSFMRQGEELFIRSRGQRIYPEDTNALFRPSIETVMRAAQADLLTDGWVYRGEAICRPKHNTLVYSRVPRGNIALFDVEKGSATSDYLDAASLELEAERIGCEAVTSFGVLSINTVDDFQTLMDNTSQFGGTKIEGLVFKNYALFGPDKKVLMAKYVSEAFKEKHTVEWKRQNPGRMDILAGLIMEYKTEARWQKAVQHLDERGELAHDPKDIGILIKEAQADVAKECREEIMERLFKFFWPKIKRGVIAGLPEWYKEHLVKSQFDTVE